MAQKDPLSPLLQTAQLQGWAMRRLSEARAVTEPVARLRLLQNFRSEMLHRVEWTAYNDRRRKKTKSLALFAGGMASGIAACALLTPFVGVPLIAAAGGLVWLPRLPENGTEKILTPYIAQTRDDIQRLLPATAVDFLDSEKEYILFQRLHVHVRRDFLAAIEKHQSSLSETQLHKVWLFRQPFVPGKRMP